VWGGPRHAAAVQVGHGLQQLAQRGLLARGAGVALHAAQPVGERVRAALGHQARRAGHARRQRHAARLEAVQHACAGRRAAGRPAGGRRAVPWGPRAFARARRRWRRTASTVMCVGGHLQRAIHALRSSRVAVHLDAPRRIRPRAARAAGRLAGRPTGREAGARPARTRRCARAGGTCAGAQSRRRPPGRPGARGTCCSAACPPPARRPRPGSARPPPRTCLRRPARTRLRATRPGAWPQGKRTR